MKVKFFAKKKFFSFFIIILFFSFLLNIVKSQEDDEEEDKKNYYVHFDLSDPDIILIEKDNPNPELKDIISESPSITIPKVELDKEGYFFSGWTEDGIYGYEPGNIFNCDKKNVTLKPVMGELSNGQFFTFEYLVEFEGEIIDTKGTLPKGNYVMNRIVKTSMMSFPQEKAIQKGWTDGKNIFYQEQKMVMPAHNVTLRAVLLYHRNLIYDSGKVDDLVGVIQNIQRGHYGAQMDLAEESRLSRKGYQNVGWHCENDGIDYPFFYQYIMPDEDVIMTAIWKPIEYTVLFKTDVNSIPNIKIKGETGTIIIAPSIDKEREGYTFIGWIMYNSDIYYPGDEIIVKGQIPGFGIAATAIWKLN